MNQARFDARTVPCRRFDRAGNDDQRLQQTLASFAVATGIDPAEVLLDLYDHDDRLWATWQADDFRTLHAIQLTTAWHENGGTLQPIHLLNIDPAPDVDEDELDCSEPE